MKTTILAIMPFDGLVFIEKDKEQYLVSPPYDETDFKEVTSQEIERAIQFNEFNEVYLEFENEDKFKNFIKTKYVEIQRLKATTSEETGSARRFLQFADDNVISKYLDNIESKLIPEKKYNQAKLLLRHIFTLEIIKKNKTLLSRAKTIFDSLNEETKSTSNWLSKLKNVAVKATIAKDKTLVCKDCNSTFIFTVSQQEFYAEKGFEGEPQRCPNCRKIKKASLLHDRKNLGNRGSKRQD